MPDTLHTRADRVACPGSESALNALTRPRRCSLLQCTAACAQEVSAVALGGVAGTGSIVKCPPFRLLRALCLHCIVECDGRVVWCALFLCFEPVVAGWVGGCCGYDDGIGFFGCRLSRLWLDDVAHRLYYAHRHTLTQRQLDRNSARGVVNCTQTLIQTHTSIEHHIALTSHYCCCATSPPLPSPSSARRCENTHECRDTSIRFYHECRLRVAAPPST